MTELHYVYGLTAVGDGDGDSDRIAALIGIADESLQPACVADGLYAWFGLVPGELLVGPEAEARLADIAWLAPRAQQHEAVLQGLLSRGAVIPCPFATVFSSYEAMCATFARQAETCVTALRQIGSGREWDCRLRVSGKQADSSPTAAEGTGPGRQFLQRKLAAKQQAAAWAEQKAVISADMQETLQAQYAERAVSLPTTGGDADSDDVVARWAVLSPDHPGATLPLPQGFDGHAEWQVAGPLPPYRFAPRA